MRVFNKIPKVGLAAALVIGSMGVAAIPANATVSGTNGAYTVSATGEPTTVAVGETASFTARVDFGSATICSTGTLKVNVPVGAGYTGTSVPIGTSGCGVNYTLSVTGVTAGTYTASVAFQYAKASIVTTTWQIQVTAAPPVDTTPPVVTINAPTEGASYFLGSVPDPDFICTDDVAVQSCTQSGFSAALGTHTMQVTGVDTSGNTSIQSVTYSVIPVPDTTPPVVSILAPADGVTYDLGSVPAADFTCEDAESTVSDCSQTGYSDQLGTHTMTVSGTSEGGSASASVTYTVVQPGPAYSFTGFYSPVNMDGVVNTIKGGKTVPLKFELFANGVEVTDPAAITFSVAPSDVCMTGAPTDAVEFTTTGGTSLRYDAATGQFVQNWKTPSTKNGCYAVTASAGAAEITAYFMTKA